LAALEETVGLIQSQVLQLLMAAAVVVVFSHLLRQILELVERVVVVEVALEVL
jgi:hypothetical protein